MLRVALLLCVLVVAFCAGDESTKNRIIADGYYTESHRVTTEDGYILEMNRIPYRRFQNASTTNTKRPVVLLMHGIMSSAISFLVLGPQTAIAYNLADAGYDVWLGNARGVDNLRHHVNLNPDDPKDKREFFDYSFEEIGLFDLSAMINYALKTTGQKNLHYVGHSQGGTVFLVMASSRPEYNAKIKSAHLLAGVGYQQDTPGTLVHLLAERTNAIYAFVQLTGLVEFDARKVRDILSPFDNELCSGANPDQTECELRSVISIVQRIKHLYQIPASIAMKQLAHYGQNIRDKTFRRWDYGSITNLLKYGRLTPPDYDLSRISTEVTWHYSLQDTILSKVDVAAMISDIPNAKAKRVDARVFLHSDYITMPSVKQLVTDYIIEDINSYL